ncbi:MAG: hypothetical protein QHH09_02155 [Microgenomates group bacterium]|jgi:hypothetical protein|nr:hypothetical protein [Microgenomates group bacterium]
MPKLRNSKNSIGAIVKKAEQGIVLTKKEQEAYQFIVVSSNQFKALTEGLRELVQSYTETAESVTGVFKQMAEMQLQFAKSLKNLFAGLEAVGKITALIQFPKFIIPTSKFDDTKSYPEMEKPLRKFIQPDKPYVAPKFFPTPKRKYKLPLTAIQVEDNGFTIEGTYIKNITRKSLIGQILELFIRADYNGYVSDKLIDDIIGRGLLKIDYVARCNTIIAPNTGRVQLKYLVWIRWIILSPPSTLTKCFISLSKPLFLM